ncbi:MAG: helix-turn-helix domain-containing protein [Myxococcales bacterium]|nr:helix-turn-helix domain-containing protein [Myxococcales bacterium]
MPAPHPIELRERVVRAYERGGESILVVAARFGVAPAALQRWLRRKREADTVAPHLGDHPKKGAKEDRLKTGQRGSGGRR